MSEPRWTKGPWFIKTGINHSAVFGADDGGKWKVASTWSESRSTAEQQANACLISAALDLYEAAKDAIESLRRLPDVDGAFRISCIQQLERAITKAEEFA
jgi:hypothetical protein